MFTIDFEFYNTELGMWCTDAFECEKSFREFTAWLQERDILNYRIIEIVPYNN
jgi:hypothetical protein